ncbi:MAG: helix-turn-helix domain-containing protein [Candidatus ainarchaeum sp.]|nr:helix-turn-helix domain-containing protein [Candidatus ainarchaeum sp.]
MNGAVAPVPEEPEGPDRVVVEEEDMDEVLPPRRGRPKRAYDRDRLTEVMRLYFLEKMSMRQVADVMGVSHMSVYRMLSDPAVELLI